MNDSLYTNGYVTLEEFFTKQQVDFFMNQVVVSLGSNELHLAANIEQKEESNNLYKSVRMERTD